MALELQETARSVLGRHPAPAIPLDELEDLVSREHAGRPLEARELARRLDGSSDDVRIIPVDQRRLGWVTPVGWAIGNEDEGAGGRCLSGRMRWSLRRLGRSLEPGSNLALARWARLLAEERRIRPSLELKSNGPRGVTAP